MRWGWKPYVSVAQRRAKANRCLQKLQKQGKQVCPVQVEGRRITDTFWGNSWCHNLESYSDFENRLPRGRTYVRNGSVVDLQITRGEIQAIVSGSEIYNVTIHVKPTNKKAWRKIKDECSHAIDSLMDLLQGRFAKSVMEKLTRQDGGLFPRPKDIEFRCSCPDWAYMCKHVAAVLYGIGARLDNEPELLFVLRGVDHLELIAEATATPRLESAMSNSSVESLGGSDLESVFGIELDDGNGALSDGSPRATKKRRSTEKSPKTTAAKRRSNASSPKRTTKTASAEKSGPKKTPKMKTVVKKASANGANNDSLTTATNEKQKKQPRSKENSIKELSAAAPSNIQSAKRRAKRHAQKKSTKKTSIPSDMDATKKKRRKPTKQAATPRQAQRRRTAAAGT